MLNKSIDHHHHHHHHHISANTALSNSLLSKVKLNIYTTRCQSFGKDPSSLLYQPSNQPTNQPLPLSPAAAAAAALSTDQPPTSTPTLQPSLNPTGSLQLQPVSSHAHTLSVDPTTMIISCQCECSRYVLDQRPQ
jgi:hypothetical protein